MTRGLGGLFGLLRRPASGAVAGQVTQALAGLVLQVAAARYLGAAGLATFALIYGLVVLVTAVASGMVGDSLTVLDRTAPRVRAGLHAWAVLVAGGAGLAGGVVAAATGVVPPWAAAVLGLAVVAFVLEDTLRRLLMATGRYWSLPAVDMTSLVFALGTLILCALAGELTLSSFFLALLAGQTAAGVVAWWGVPATERLRGPWRSPDLGAVWSFGVWRAAAQMIRPGLLSGLRFVVVGLAGAAAYGPLEAARVYTAPTLTIVAGLGSFLLPHYVTMSRNAAGENRPVTRALRSADRVAMGLAGAVAMISVAAVLLQPVVEPLLTGGDYDMPVLAVAGWGAYAVAGAVLLPYSGVATVQRRQRRVLAFRLLEFVALGVVTLLVLLVGGGQEWAPLALAAGPLLAAVAVRQAVLRPLARQEHAAPRAAVSV
jgi:O-antigen/teichoic acid export membrane protein